MSACLIISIYHTLWWCQPFFAAETIFSRQKLVCQLEFKDIISIRKAALNADEDSDMELLHPAFLVLSIESSQSSVIFSSDGKCTC